MSRADRIRASKPVLRQATGEGWVDLGELLLTGGKARQGRLLGRAWWAGTCPQMG